MGQERLERLGLAHLSPKERDLKLAQLIEESNKEYAEGQEKYFQRQSQKRAEEQNKYAKKEKIFLKEWEVLITDEIYKVGEDIYPLNMINKAILTSQVFPSLKELFINIIVFVIMAMFVIVPVSFLYNYAGIHVAFAFTIVIIYILWPSFHITSKSIFKSLSILLKPSFFIEIKTHNNTRLKTLGWQNRKNAQLVFGALIKAMKKDNDIK